MASNDRQPRAQFPPEAPLRTTSPPSLPPYAAPAAVPLAVRDIPATAGASSPLRQLAARDALAMDSGASLHLEARTGKVKHGQPGMDDGAIAGLVVGVIAAVGLLIFCFYPFIRRQFRRRRNADRPPFDTEAAMAADSGATPGTVLPTRRLSSSDSFKQATQTSRGGPDGRPSKDLGWSQDGSQYAVGDGQSQHPPSVGADGAAQEQGRSSTTGPQPTPFPPLDGEFYPISTHDDQPGVLKGTSADYYSPNIPSEAFGMVTSPTSDSQADVPNRSDRSLSRGSSLRYNVKQMFHPRKSGRDRTMSSHASSDDPSSPSSAAPQPRAVTPMERIITDADPTTSPIDVSPTTVTIPRGPLRGPSPPIIKAPTRPPPDAMAKTPPQSSPSHFKGSPSPPAQPAPGTVNPMDIMAPSTESEMWHRTEHQLFVSSFDSPPSHTASAEPPEIEFAQILPSPSPTSEATSYPTHRILSPTPTTTDPNLKQEPAEEEDVVMKDIPSQNHLSPMPLLGPGRHPSYASEISTPLPGPASTVPSSQNTPSTQLDSPSPQSMGSSDFRQSASPQLGLSVPSPKNGIFRCEEPGCSQTFDQPHKLKHHQRYHSKDHKCHYAGCGKGFGTKTHLQRHINDRHEKKKKYHCAVQGCDYSRAGGKAFPRKDNWKRHMTKIHNMDHQDLPEPIEVDADMGGT